MVKRFHPYSQNSNSIFHITLRQLFLSSPVEAKIIIFQLTEQFKIPHNMFLEVFCEIASSKKSLSIPSKSLRKLFLNDDPEIDVFFEPFQFFCRTTILQITYSYLLLIFKCLRAYTPFSLKTI